MTRRTALTAGALGLGGVLLAGEGLAGAATTGASATPKRGGRLRVGHVGGGKGESFNPGRGSSFIDASRAYNLYDPLVRVNPDFSQSPGLALSWTPNADRDEVRDQAPPRRQVARRLPVHRRRRDLVDAPDGRPEARRIGGRRRTSSSPSSRRPARSSCRSRSRGRTRASRTRSCSRACVIVKNGYKNFAKPIGTGPFKFKSFEIGVRSLCVRNPDYWQNGKPYVDEWEDISIDDNSARLNALLGGQIDMMSQLDFAQAKAQKKTKKIQVIDAPSPAYQVFIMRVDRPPFNDVNVRQAIRLIVDRQALINVALGGFGTVGNDLFGYGLPYYAKSLKPREQDIEQAKSLLKKAGKSNLAVTLQTSDIVPGFTQAATLLAQQAKEAGVNDHDQEGGGQLVLRHVAAVHEDGLRAVVLDDGLAGRVLQPVAGLRRDVERDPLQGSGVRQDGPPGDRRTHGRRGHRGSGTRCRRSSTTRGGYIGWANQNIVDAASNKVKGIKPSAFFNLGGFNYRDVWLG